MTKVRSDSTREPSLSLRKKKSTHPVFSQLLEYKTNQDKWLETGRWIKFEEKVEEGSRRWSKPFVPGTCLVSMLQLSTCINDGIVILNSEGHDYTQMMELVIQAWLNDGALTKTQVPEVRALLYKKKRHQFEQVFNDTVTRVLSKEESHMYRPEFDRDKRISSSDLDKYLLRASVDQCSDVDKEKLLSNSNRELFNKLPIDTVACNLLVGECSVLDKHAFAFVRLKHQLQLPELTEVPVPTKFIFILLGPVGYAYQFRQIGRAAAALMCDPEFQKLPFVCDDKRQLLTGIDAFLDKTIVLPPGSWNKNIRIQPTIGAEQKLTVVKDTSHDHPDSGNDYIATGGNVDDSALQWSGRLFGGLARDIKRKLKWYKSDFKDAMDLQCVGSFFFMYVAMLAPVVTFGGLLEEGTGQRLAVVENLLAACFCGVTYSLFSGQPLTVVGSTGPILVCETMIFELCKVLHVNYLPFRFWINFWAAIILLLVVAFDGSVIIKYVTRFTGEAFASLIATIFIVKAVQSIANVYFEETEYAIYSANSTSAYCYCQPRHDNTTEDWFEKLTIHEHWKNSWLTRQPWYHQTVVYMNDTMWSIDYHHAYGDENPDQYNLVDVDYTQVPLDLCNKLHGDLVGTGCYASHNVFFMSLFLSMGTYILCTLFTNMRNTPFLPTFFRRLISNFSITWAILLMVGLNEWTGLNTSKLNIPEEIRPTFLKRKHWWVDPLDDPFWTIPAAIPPAIFVAILIFLDHQLTSLIVNRPENKLRKGSGYHLDLFIIAIQTFFMGLFGLPIYVAATVRSMNHVRSLKMESNVKIPGDVGSYVGVREQRLTGFFSFVVIGLSVFLAPVLRHIPMAVLYGVFLYMGVQALDGIQIIDRLLLMLMPNKYQPDIPYLRHIRMLRIHLFTLIQVLLLAVLWVIKLLPFVAIIFPLMFVVMVIIRFLMRHCFTDMELVALDEDLPPPFGNKVSSGNRYRSPSGDTSSIGTKNGASTLLSSERRTNTGLNDELSLSMARSPSKIRFAEQEKFEDEVFDKVETPTSPSYGGLAPSRFSYHNKLPWMPEAKCSETDERGAGTP